MKLIKFMIDIGANLTHESFTHDLPFVLERAKNTGIEKIIVTGANLESIEKSNILTNEYPDYLLSTVGIHPHYANEFKSNTVNYLKQSLNNSNVVAIGECGLDYYRNYSSKKEQEIAFRAQLELAIEIKKPLFLHQRNSFKDFINILTPYLNDINAAVAHCFTGTKNELLELLDLGLYIGITGWICDERRGMHLKDIVSLIPDNRLMIETDAPYLLPRTIINKTKTRRNEPAYLEEVLKEVASCRNQTRSFLDQKTTDVSKKFFDLN